MCARLDTTGLLADVTYAVLHGQTEAGRERLRLYRRADGGVWMTMDGDWTAHQPGEPAPGVPALHAMYVEAHAGADWGIESLVMRLSGPEQRDAAFHFDGVLWRGAIQTDQATLDRAVPFRPDMLVIFDSIASATLAFHRLALAERQRLTIDVIRMDLSSLEPVPTRLPFECIGREPITTAVGKVEALHYFAGTRHWWADSRGMLVAATGYQLLEYHWLGP